jgi:hypothetical protein
MIVNLRGTHGSGKSTAVKRIIERFGAQPCRFGKKERPEAYVMQTPFGRLYVAGPYHTPCGGCDAIQPYSRIWPMVESLAESGHVLFEGALVSGSYGSIGEASERYGDEFVFAFMDTPLEECLRRIKARRQARGDNRTLDPTNTISKYKGVARVRERLLNGLDRRVVDIDHRKPVPQLLRILNEQDQG